MAIDSRIALGLQPLNIGQRFAQNVQNLQQVDLLNQRREQAPFQNQLLQLQTELAQAQQPANLLQAERAASPLTQQLLTQQQMDAFELSNAQALKPFLDSNDAQGAIAQLNRQKQQAKELGLADEVAEVDAAIQAIQSPEGFGRVKQATDSFLQLSGGIPQAQQQRVTASKILDDGTTVQSLSTGGTNVVSPQGEVLQGDARKQALDKALKTKVEQKGDAAQVVSDVKVKEAIRLEKETEKGRQEIELGKINIDETKFKNAEQRKQAIDAKIARRDEADNAIQKVDSLLKGGRFTSAFGKVVTTTPELLRTQEAIDAIADLDQIRGLLSLESRQKLKGQGTITDSEAKTLAQSATVLNNSLISDEAARKELRRIKRIFEDASDRNQLKRETREQLNAETSQPTVIKFDNRGNIIQ